MYSFNVYTFDTIRLQNWGTASFSLLVCFIDDMYIPCSLFGVVN
jgi:hypothetical protein